MDRRDFLASSIALAFASALHAPARAEPGSEASRARALYEAIFEKLLVAAPQTATSLGLDTGRHAAARSRLDDRSPAGRMNVLGPADRSLAAVAVDRCRAPRGPRPF